ncbi:lipid A deacylase LpxR family protein [Halopseudomonas xinjiangensis]|nr:lipid A deacylase LpxR family protein [Halopseudomonas xinjiangensis]
MNRGPWGASLSYQVGTDQFEGQTTETRFGSLAVAYLF